MTRGPTIDELRTHGAFMLSELKRNHGGFFSGETMTQTLTTERQQFEEWFNEEMVLHISTSNEAVVRLMWKAWQASRELLANREAQPVGYFVRHRSVWDKPSLWSIWTECSAEDYVEYCKRIATGEADAGWFYEARILYDAPPAPGASR